MGVEKLALAAKVTAIRSGFGSMSMRTAIAKQIGVSRTAVALFYTNSVSTLVSR